MDTSGFSNSFLPEDENSNDVEEVHFDDPLKNCIYLIADDSDDNSSDVCILDDNSSDVNLKTKTQNSNRQPVSQDYFGVNKIDITNDRVTKQNCEKNKSHLGVGVSDADFRIEEIQTKKKTKPIKFMEQENSKEKRVETFLSSLKKRYDSDTKNYILSFEDNEVLGSSITTNKEVKSNDKIKKPSSKKNKSDIASDISDPDFRIEKIQTKRKRKPTESIERENGKQIRVERFLNCLKESYSNDTNSFNSYNGESELLELSESADKDSEDVNVSNRQVCEILLLAWRIEIEKQESKIRYSWRKRKTCDCKIVYETLTEKDNTCKTKKRVNYLARFNCCQFRKAILGSTYYVPKNVFPSSTTKRELTQNEKELAPTISSTDKLISNDDYPDDNGNENDQSVVDSFDKLIALEFSDPLKSPQSNDNGYCSES